MAQETKETTGWRFLDHPADIRVEISGSNIEEFFTNAAFALTHVLSGGKDLEWEGTAKIDLTADNIEELFINWLRELLFQHEVNGLLPTGIDFLDLNDVKLSAELMNGRHGKSDEAEVEIKGVTYYGLSVEKSEAGYSAKVIFDI
jgi:SHS2 domain-containing protein